MRCTVIAIFIHIIYGSEHLDLPEWTKYPVATCPEIVKFLTIKCSERPHAWIPFTFVNKTRADQIECLKCRQRRRLERVCENDLDTLRPLSLFDTRVCTS